MPAGPFPGARTTDRPSRPGSKSQLVPIKPLATSAVKVQHLQGKKHCSYCIKYTWNKPASQPEVEKEISQMNNIGNGRARFIRPDGAGSQFSGEQSCNQGPGRRG